MNNLIVLFCISAAALALSMGCKSGPEPAPNQRVHRWAEMERSSIKSFMREVEELIQEADYDAIMRSSFYSRAPFYERHENYKNIKRATWIPELSGYQILNIDNALRKLHWQHLTNIGQVSFTVDATCARGTVWKDRFELYRPETDWILTSASMRTPEPGQIVELQDYDAESILDLAEPVLHQLEKGDIHTVQEMFPNTYESRFRAHEPSWFGRILGRAPKVIPVRDELEKLEQLNIQNWPEPGQGLPARFAGGMSLKLSYPLQHRNNNNDSIIVHIFVSENEDKQWVLRKLRIDGVL